MSSLLSLKQLLCQLDTNNLEQALNRVCTLNNKVAALQVCEKGYRCVQADVSIQTKKLSSGFGKSEQEAVTNARRTALEALIDQTKPPDFDKVKAILLNQALEKENQPSEVSEQHTVIFIVETQRIAWDRNYSLLFIVSVE